MKFKPHHVAFTVKNLDESIQWYQNIGFILKERYGNKGREIAHLTLDEVRIELFDYGDLTKPLPSYRKNLMDDLHTIGTKHLCIDVENLEETIKAFSEKGVTFATEIDTAGFGGHYIFLKDCNGILIELYQI